MLHETRYPSCCSNSSAKYRGHAAEHAASRREQVKIPLLVTVAIILRGAAFAGLTARICGERPLVDFQGLTNQLPPTYTMTTSRLPLSSCSRIGFQLSQVPSYGHSNIDLYLASCVHLLALLCFLVSLICLRGNIRRHLTSQPICLHFCHVVFFGLPPWPSLQGPFR